MLALMVYVDSDIEDDPFKLLCFFFMATTACLTIVVQGGVFELVLWVSITVAWPKNFYMCEPYVLETLKNEVFELVLWVSTPVAWPRVSIDVIPMYAETVPTHPLPRNIETYTCVCVCVCLRTCVRACVRACVCSTAAKTTSSFKTQKENSVYMY